MYGRLTLKYEQPVYYFNYIDDENMLTNKNKAKQ
jgi:hypothetical protein